MRTHKLFSVIACCAVALAVLPGAVSAVDSTLPHGWMVIDNGPDGLPGNNQYAYRCDYAFNYRYPSNAINVETTAEGKAAASCAFDVLEVPADNGRVSVRVEVLSSGTVCAGGSGESVSSGGYARATKRFNSWTGCSMTATRHTAAYWGGSFCSGPDCVWGWMAWSASFPV